MKPLNWTCTARGAQKCEKYHFCLFSKGTIFLFLGVQETHCDCDISSSLTNQSSHNQHVIIAWLLVFLPMKYVTKSDYWYPRPLSTLWLKTWKTEKSQKRNEFWGNFGYFSHTHERKLCFIYILGYEWTNLFSKMLWDWKDMNKMDQWSELPASCHIRGKPGKVSSSIIRSEHRSEFSKDNNQTIWSSSS